MTTNPTRSPKVDDLGIHLAGPLAVPLNIMFDGQRVWSVLPSRDGVAADDDTWLVRWPRSLCRYLDGVADVELSSLDGSQTIFHETVRFGTAAGPIRVVSDDSGRPAAVDKTGRLGRIFSAADPASINLLMDAVEDALVVLNDVAGVPGFLSFGALLGAARDGHLIGHDNDADISYLAESSHPFDVIRESYRIERIYRDRGWRTVRMSAADFKLMLPWPQGGDMGIDVFTAFYVEEYLYIMGAIRGKLRRSALVPTSTVELEGRKLAAPADPEAVNELCYGPGWRIPDPSFHYSYNRDVSRHLTGWMRGERRSLRPWEEFYKDHAHELPQGPSSFAAWVEGRIPERGFLVDVGCGTGRDALWFAERGLGVLATETSAIGIRRTSRRADLRGLDIMVRYCNLYDLRDVLTLGAQLANVRRPDAVYARFLLNAITRDGRRNLWRLARMALAGGDGMLYLEFRAAPPPAYHFQWRTRHHADPDEVVAELAEYGFTVVEREQATGLAVLGDEDPLICRIAARVEE